jgi:predicted N-acyltransferase
VFSRINSWLTGQRLVSLPFADHCDPLVDSQSDMQELLALIQSETREKGFRYIEFRPVHQFRNGGAGFHSTYSYCFHELNLEPSIDALFRGFHKDSTQRKIRRAEREGLRYEEGRSGDLLEHFYHLFFMTRRRHQVPPQPRNWFRNLIDCFGESLKVRVAFRNQSAVAAILTVCHRNTLVYKYGCSDVKFNNLGGMQFLFWRAIQEAKKSGLHFLDLGRSDWENTGLITFKDRWGAVRSTLTYSRYTAAADSPGNFAPANADWKLQFAKHFFAHAPKGVLLAAGRVLYKHVG